MQDPIKRKALYDYLAKEKMTDLDYNTFSTEYATNPEKQQKLFDYLSTNKMTDLDYNSFSSEYFGDVKKKDSSQEKSATTPSQSADIPLVTLSDKEVGISESVTVPNQSEVKPQVNAPFTVPQTPAQVGKEQIEPTKDKNRVTEAFVGEIQPLIPNPNFNYSLAESPFNLKEIPNPEYKVSQGKKIVRNPSFNENNPDNFANPRFLEVDAQRNISKPIKRSSIYEVDKQELSEVNQQQEQIRYKYESISSLQNIPVESLLQSDQTYQELNKKKQQLERSVGFYNNILSEIAKDTNAKFSQDGSFLRNINSTFGIKETPTEIAELNEGIKNQILLNISDNPLLQQKIARGSADLEEKEAIISQAKSEYLRNEIQNIKFAQEVIINSDETVDEKNKKLEELKNVYETALGAVGVDEASGYVKDTFRKTKEARDFDETYGGEGALDKTNDIITTFIGGLVSTSLDASVGFIGDSMAAVGDLFTDQDDYSSFDAFSDTLRRVTSYKFLPNSQKESKKIVDENGNLNLSFETAGNSLAQTIPFTMFLISEARKGKISNLERTLGGYLNPKNTEKASQSIKLVESAFKATFSGNLEQAKADGLTGYKAMIAASANSMAEGLTNTIMPDTKFLDSSTGKAIVRAFSGNLKSAVNRKAAGVAVGSFFKNIFGELAEEETNLFLQDMVSTALVVGHDNSDFFNVRNQKELIAATTLMSGAMGTFGLLNTRNQERIKIYDNISLNITQIKSDLNNELLSEDINEDGKKKIKQVIEYAESIDQAVKKSPETVTSDQIEFLAEKQRLIEKKKTLDSAFHEPINEEIASLDEKIKESGKQRQGDFFDINNVRERDAERNAFDPLETEEEAIIRLRQGLEGLEGKERADAIENIAEQHEKSYLDYVATQPNSEEILNSDFAKNFKQNAIDALSSNKEFKATEETDQDNGSRVDEEGNQITEVEFLEEQGKIEPIEDEVSPTVEMNPVNTEAILDELNEINNKYPQQFSSIEGIEYGESPSGKKVINGKIDNIVLSPKDFKRSEFEGQENRVEEIGAENIDLSEPIEATMFSNGEIKVADGHHRLIAALKLGENLKVNLSFRNVPTSFIPKILSEGYSNSVNEDFASNFVESINKLTKNKVEAQTPTQLEDIGTNLQNMNKAGESMSKSLTANLIKQVINGDYFSNKKGVVDELLMEADLKGYEAIESEKQFGNNKVKGWKIVKIDNPNINKIQLEEKPNQQPKTVSKPERQTTEIAEAVKQEPSERKLTEAQEKQNKLVDARNQYNRSTLNKKRSKEGQNLKMNVIQLASDLGFTVGEKRGKLSVKTDRGTEAGKISFKEQIPNAEQADIDFATSEIESGVLNWDGDPNTPRIDLGMDRQDVRKGEKDILRGKPNTVPAKRLIQAFKDARKNGVYEYFEGSGGQINRIQVAIAEAVKIDNELTAEELEIFNTQQEQEVLEYDEWFNNLDEKTQNEILDDYENNQGTISENEQSRESQANDNNEAKNKEVNLSESLKIDDFLANLNSISDQLDKFGNETLGMNLPIAVAKIAINAMKVAGKTAKTTADVISAGLNAVKNSDWYKNLNTDDKANVDTNFVQLLNKPFETENNLPKQNKQAKREVAKKAISEARKKITERFRNKQTEAESVKKQLVDYIKTIIDTGIVKGSNARDVVGLLRSVEKAKTNRSLITSFNKVNKIVSSVENKILKSQIESIIKKPKDYLKKVNGKNKARKIDNDTRKILKEINKWYEQSSEKIQEKIDALESDLIETDLETYIALNTALEIARARESELAYKENKNIKLIEDAVNQNEVVLDTLKSLVETGKSKLSEQVKNEAQRLKDITTEAVEDTETTDSGKTKIEIQQEQFEKKNRFFNLLSKRYGEAKKINLAKASTFSFEYLMGYIDRKANHGLGRLYDRFYSGKDGLLQKDNNFKKDSRQIQSEIKAKLEGILGQKFNNLFSNYFQSKDLNKVRDSKIKLTNEDGDIGKGSLPLSYNQALYIHLVSKMESQNEQLRNQGWTDESFEQLETFLGNKYIKVSDFITEFLQEKYSKYNETHLELLRTDLGFEEGYFPTKYDKIDLNYEVDLSGSKFSLGSVMSVNMIEKVKNNNRIDISQNAFDILNQYLESMEKFHHYGRFTKDLNAVLNNKTFKNNVTAYDQKAYDDLVKVSKAVIGDKSDFNSGIEEKWLYNFNASIASGFILFKGWTALKQFLSMPAYTEFAKMFEVGGYKIPLFHKTYFGLKMAVNMNPYSIVKNYRFLKENSVSFSERMKRGDLGNEFVKELLNSQGRKNFVSKLLQNFLSAGIAPNKLIDALTISTGGKVYYDQQNKHYRKNGLNTKEAHEQAIRDVEVAFLTTQQSSDVANLSGVQVKKGALTALFLPFKNAQLGYFRRIAANKNNILRRYSNEKQKFIKQGASETQARVKAFGKVSSDADTFNELSNILLYTHILPLMWQYVASGLPGLLTAWDDDDEDEMIRTLYLGPIDGLFIINDLASYIYNQAVLKKRWNFKSAILSSEMQTIVTDVLEASKESGYMNEDVLLEVGKGYLKTKSIQTPTFTNIYEGAENLILTDENYQESIFKLLNAPKELSEVSRTPQEEKQEKADAKAKEMAEIMSDPEKLKKYNEAQLKKQREKQEKANKKAEENRKAMEKLKNKSK